MSKQDKEAETITCRDIERTIIRAYLYQNVFLKVAHLFFWTTMVVLMYLATVGIQGSRDNYFMIHGIIGTFESDFRKFPISEINSHVSVINPASFCLSLPLFFFYAFFFIVKEAFYDYVYKGILSGITDEDVPGRMTENNQIT